MVALLSVLIISQSGAVVKMFDKYICVAYSRSMDADKYGMTYAGRQRLLEQRKARHELAHKLRRDGLTLAAIGRVLRISRQRVWQILARR